MLGGMAVGLLIVIGILIVVMQKSDGALGPAPMISGMMLTLATLLPFGFGIFALSYAGTDPVEAFFRPEAPPEEQKPGEGDFGADAPEPEKPGDDYGADYVPPEPPNPKAKTKKAFLSFDLRRLLPWRA